METKMCRPNINEGKLLWSGEHWINYIRKDGEDEDSARVSLYHTRYSLAGEGTVAYVTIGGDEGFEGICTDNAELVPYLSDIMRPPFNVKMPVYEATFKRTGDIRREPSWVIEAGQNTIISTWKDIEPPVIAEGWAPFFTDDRDFFTMLFFTDVASITLNGRQIDGEPYPRDVWKKSIGGDRSSAIFALAESMIEA